VIEIEFQSFGKIGRLFRDVVITEKIDGTNAAVGIKLASYHPNETTPFIPDGVKVIDRGGFEVNGMCNFALVYAQSRTRLIHPGMDNHGFARWVWDNAEYLVENLGEGLHFGEWWGSGINRGYGLPKGEKRFSLFNTHRWGDIEFNLPSLSVVPVLFTGPFDTGSVTYAMDTLRQIGSLASPGFMRPEGVVVYHRHANALFKATLENDTVPKSLVDNGD
jgi:hypothetical protein